MYRGLIVIVITVGLVGSGLGYPQPNHPIKPLRADDRIALYEDPADIKDSPYQVSVLYLTSQICGGSIISKKYVLTAAECTAGNQAVSLSIRAGSSFSNTGGVVIKVKAIHQHPQYDDWSKEYDVSVLELASDLPLSDTIAIVPLPKTYLPSSSIGVSTGWTDSKNSNNLYAISMYYITREECAQYWAVGAIKDSMFCAFEQVPQTNIACSNQFIGGPLMIDGVQFGMTTWGNDCVLPNYPIIIGNVFKFLEFVNEVTGGA